MNKTKDVFCIADLFYKGVEIRPFSEMAKSIRVAMPMYESSHEALCREAFVLGRRGKALTSDWFNHVKPLHTTQTATTEVKQIDVAEIKKQLYEIPMKIRILELEAQLDKAAQLLNDWIKADRWISIKERLPEEGQCVQVYLESGKQATCYYSSGQFIDSLRFQHSNGGVTHWKPLSIAPTESKFDIVESFKIHDWVVDKFTNQVFEIRGIEGDEFFNQHRFWCNLNHVRSATTHEVAHYLRVLHDQQ